MSLITSLISLDGAPESVLPEAEKILGEIPALSQLERLTQAFSGAGMEKMLRIDFSVVGDINYYNGVIFKGFVEGVPESVLSGGQYDRLMHKLGRKSGAIGFAVYTDPLERLVPAGNSYDVDIIVLYDENTDISKVSGAVSRLKNSGRRVVAQRSIPEKLRYRQLARIINGEVVVIEDA